MEESHVKNIIAVKQGKKPIKFRADLHLIAGCNSQCIMCDNWKNKVESNFSTENAIKLLDQLKNFGVTYIRFHGQEPTLRRDLPLLIKGAKKRGFRVAVKTNALLLNKKMMNEIVHLLDDIYSAEAIFDHGLEQQLACIKKIPFDCKSEDIPDFLWMSNRCHGIHQIRCYDPLHSSAALENVFHLPTVTVGNFNQCLFCSLL